MHMHYRIKGILIKSENAAKPMMDAAGPLIEWLKQRPYTHSALDYGCGKLRYTRHLAARSRHLGITDSTVQLDRVQRIGGQMTNVRQYANAHWPTCHIYQLNQFWQGIPRSYGFILCANVLSAIPCPRIRARSLRALRAALTSNGTLLVVNQHMNSYFAEARQKSKAFAHLDGWVQQSRKGAAYYGILNQESTIRVLTRFGFLVADAWNSGQSNYVLVRRNTT
jgi:hypothetical protein